MLWQAGYLTNTRRLGIFIVLLQACQHRAMLIYCSLVVSTLSHVEWLSDFIYIHTQGYTRAIKVKIIVFQAYSPLIVMGHK